MADDERPRRLRAEWAFISKLPGSADDYSILGASRGPIGVRDLAWKYVAGLPSPALPLDAPGAPPWLIFGAHPGAEGPVVSASVQLPPEPDEGDQGGRPIWPRSFFASWFRDVADCGASYQALADAIERQEGLDGDDPAPVSLAVVPQRVTGDAGLTASVQEFGVKRMATIASLLLHGHRVALTGAAGLPRRNRLRLLDAAVALLPYGCRATVTASSAVDRKITHSIQLVITDFPDEGSQVLVGLQSAPPALPAESAEALYYRKALERGSTSTWEDLTAYLWDHREAIESPHQALEVLERFHRPLYLWKGIRESDPVPLREALGVFHGPASAIADLWRRERAESPDSVRKVLTTLLDSDQPAAADALVRNWPIASEDLAALVNADLSEGRLHRARRSLEIAVRTGAPSVPDWLLTQLLVPDSVRRPYDEPIRHRLDLLRDWPVPAPDTFTKACDALRWDRITEWQAGFVYGLLTEEDKADPTGQRLVDWARWLCITAFPHEWDCPDWVRALGFVVPGALVESAGSIRRLRDEDSGWMSLIVRLAAASGKLPKLLAISDMDQTLIQLAREAGGAGTGTHRLGGDRAARLAHAFASPLRGAVPAEKTAAVDVVRILLSQVPLEFPLDGDDDFSQYLDGLDRGLGFLAQWPGEGEAITRQLLDYLFARADEAETVSLAPGLEQLVLAWTSNGARVAQLARYLADFLDSAGILSAILADAKDQGGRGVAGLLVSRVPLAAWSRLMNHDPRLDAVDSLKRIETAVKEMSLVPGDFRPKLIRDGELIPGLPAAGLSMNPLAVAMYDAHYAGLPTSGILTAIKTEYERFPSSERIKPRDLVFVLAQFQQLVRYHAPDVPSRPSAETLAGLDAYSELAWLMCYRDIVNGQLFGEPFGQEFAAAAKELGVNRKRHHDHAAKTFPGESGVLRNRPRAADARFRAWLKYLNGRVANIDPAFLPPPSAQPSSPRSPQATASQDA